MSVLSSYGDPKIENGGCPTRKPSKSTGGPRTWRVSNQKANQKAHTHAHPKGLLMGPPHDSQARAESLSAVGLRRVYLSSREVKLGR